MEMIKKPVIDVCLKFSGLNAKEVRDWLYQQMVNLPDFKDFQVAPILSNFCFKTQNTKYTVDLIEYSLISSHFNQIKVYGEFSCLKFPSENGSFSFARSRRV